MPEPPPVQGGAPSPGYPPPPPAGPPAWHGAPPPAYPGWGAAPPMPPGGWAPAWGVPYGIPPPHLPGSGRFHAMSLGELLDAVFSLYRRNFLLIAAISAVVRVPYSVLTTLLLTLTGFASLASGTGSGSFTISPGQQQLTPQQVHLIAGLFGVELGLALLSALVVLPLATAATTRAVSDRYLDQPTSLGTSYRAALQRLGPLVVQSLILLGGTIALAALLVLAVVVAALAGPAGILIAILAAIAFVVAVVFLYIKTSLAAPAIVLERVSGWRGLVRSWNLVRGQFWRILGIRLLVAIITAVISGIVTGLLSIAGAGFDTTGRFLINEAAGAFAAVFVSPITYITVTLLYYDTRIRKEGFDIEMLARSL